MVYCILYYAIDIHKYFACVPKLSLRIPGIRLYLVHNYTEATAGWPLSSTGERQLNRGKICKKLSEMFKFPHDVFRQRGGESNSLYHTCARLYRLPVPSIGLSSLN